MHIALARALIDAMRQGLVHRNACQAAEAPSPGRYQVKVPDALAIKKILALAGSTPYGLILHFAAYTGCRRAEALGLRWSDSDLEKCTASLVQTLQRLKGKELVLQPSKSAKSRRSIALAEDTVDMRREHKGRQLPAEVELEGVCQSLGLIFPGPHLVVR